MISFFQHPIISQEKAGADKEKKNASCNEGHIGIKKPACYQSGNDQQAVVQQAKAILLSAQPGRPQSRGLERVD
jgi:hypothetical protein